MKTHMTTTLRNLVLKELNPAAQPMSTLQINKWLEELPRINESMVRLMQILVFSSLSNRLVNRHIRQIQRESIFLINTLQNYDPDTIPERMKPFHTSVLHSIEEILKYIKTQHPEFFNLDLDVPAAYFCTVAKDLRQKLNQLVAALRKKDVEKPLLALVSNNISDFLKAGQCSYSKLGYMERLLASLTGVCSLTEKDGIDEQLKEHLFYCNLNTAAHVKYYKTKIETELTQLFDQQEKYELFCTYEKQFRSYPQQKTPACNPRNKSIKLMMLDYIGAEIACIRKSLQYNASKVNVPADLGRRPVESSLRLRVTFSVNALAYFFKLLNAAGAIDGGPLTQLMVFIARNFQTPGIGNAYISPNSLGKKYNQTVQTTARNVRALLVKMLKILDKEFAA